MGAGRKSARACLCARVARRRVLTHLAYVWEERRRTRDTGRRRIGGPGRGARAETLGAAGAALKRNPCPAPPRPAPQLRSFGWRCAGHYILLFSHPVPLASAGSGRRSGHAHGRGVADRDPIRDRREFVKVKLHNSARGVAWHRTRITVGASEDVWALAKPGTTRANGTPARLRCAGPGGLAAWSIGIASCSSLVLGLTAL